MLSVGKPDPPQKVDVLEITKNSAKVGWVKPMRDGGAKIDGYIIDYLELPEPKITKEPVVRESEVEPGAEPVPPPPPVVKKEEVKEGVKAQKNRRLNRPAAVVFADDKQNLAQLDKQQITVL